MYSLFRLQNVTTKRTERINSDEEERLRLGFELRTAVRFTESAGRPTHRVATAERDGETIMRLDYGSAATIWRINLGWRRRQNRQLFGFLLDTERGYWAANNASTDDDSDDPMSARVTRVIPFVEDHRNCLLIEPAGNLSAPVMASLGAALKAAAQVRYQLEDSEIAVEALPDENNRRLLLIYEAAEGGAGVLKNLLDDPLALQDVAKRALEICHYDPQTGEDRRRAPGAKEDCEAACYDCLMNYGNQRDHKLLDRKALRDFLLNLASCRCRASPAHQPRTEHLALLERLCESELERKWLRMLNAKNLRLPMKAQVLIESCQTRPDFLYEEALVAVYVDGPPHDFPDRQQRDATATERMEDFGLYGNPLWASGELAGNRGSIPARVWEGILSFAAGSLVRARGREWVVLPESEEDLLVMRPLGGTDEEIAGIYLPLETVEPASFSLPDPTQIGDHRSCRLLRDAVRLGFRSSAGPFRSFARLGIEPRPYQLVPLLMALQVGPCSAAYCRRRRYREND